MNFSYNFGLLMIVALIALFIFLREKSRLNIFKYITYFLYFILIVYLLPTIIYLLQF
ncbi:hypothetical protein TEHD23766T_1938 [Tetragenococcus halophilus subsp. flandriensis]|nr:hypothetical protein TEHD23766T_1938 [Tetragenococcus halophilus subsp. flandriensis]